jgi:periplasmic mercuric ion binding protein
MKRLLAWPCFALALVLNGPVAAGTKTVTLSVPGMNCAACPITVKKALGKVPGVAKTDVNLDKRQAAVTFDDALTNVEALMQATKNAGFPSTPVGSAQ